VSDIRPPRQITTAGVLTAIAGTALFVWLVWTRPHEIWTGVQKIGWGLVWIFALGGVRFATRAAAWALCVEPPYALQFSTAFAAVVCGDAVGNVTPLGPLASEPTKIACVRGRLPIGPKRPEQAAQADRQPVRAAEHGGVRVGAGQPDRSRLRVAEARPPVFARGA
jgi:hypothetical protein